MSWLGNLVGTSTSSTSHTSQNQNPLNNLMAQLLPPSPNDILKSILLIVGVVSGVGLILGAIYLLTRRGKGARNV